MSVLQEYNIFKNIFSFFPLSKHGLCPITHGISLVKSVFTLEKSQLIIYFNNIKNIIIKSSVATWLSLYLLPIIAYFIGDMSLILMIFPLSLFTPSTSNQILLDTQILESTDKFWNKSMWFSSRNDVVLANYSANELKAKNLYKNYLVDTYGIRDIKLLQDPSIKEKIIKWFKNINFFKMFKKEDINESKWWD